MDSIACAKCGRAIDAAKIRGPVRCTCGTWFDLPQWRGGYFTRPPRGASGDAQRLPYSLADRWHAIHRWPLRNPRATPAEVAAFFAAWDSPIVSCKECREHWAKLKTEIPPKLDTAADLADCAHRWHNAINARTGRPIMSRDECDRIHGQTTVGFLSAAYSAFGGTETWHRTIVPRLAGVRVAGLVATAYGGGDPTPLRCRYGIGIQAARDLAAQCDVVVAWGISTLADLLPAANRPAVINVHHGDTSSDWSNGICRQGVIDALVAVNAEVAEDLRRSRPDIRVEHIANAVDPNRIQPRRQVETDGRPIAVWCARFSPEKRLDLAIAAAALLPDWRFVVIGSSRFPADPLPEAPPNVTFAGALPDQADWLSVADVFLSTADQEGFGLSMAEAMAAGVRVVATPFGLGANPALCRRLAANPTPAEIAAAIRLAPGETAQAERARRWILRNHSAESIVGRWDRLICELAAANGRPVAAAA